jgi:hypothetical protein
MMNWFFRWWTKGFERYNSAAHTEARNIHAEVAARNFDGGMTFQLIDAENGKILKVMVPDPNGSLISQASSARRHFNPHSGNVEKLYVIPEGEDVMAFITRALVEERIK